MNTQLQSGGVITTRKSNIELLRIIAMSVILIYHFIHYSSSAYESSAIVRAAVFSVLYWGVNVFVMISGYFGIKARLKSFLKLYTLTGIFILAGYALLLIAGKPVNIVSLIMQAIFPFTKGGYWFMASYFGLFITAPLISAGLSQMPMKTLRWFIVAFSLFTIVPCGLMQNTCNPNGYTYMQFVYLYALGHYLHREQWLDVIKAKAWWAGAALIAVAEFSLLTVISVILNHESGYFIRYNNMFVIAESICIFMAFTRLNFSNRLVNKVAVASLGCYLLQDGVLGHNFMYSALRNAAGGYAWLWFIGAFVGIWAISWCITALKQSTVDKWISNLSNSVEQRLISLTTTKQELRGNRSLK